MLYGSVSRFYLLAAVFFALVGTYACTDDNANPVLFTAKDDLVLGQRVSRHLDSAFRAQNQLLPRNEPRNARAYQLLDKVVGRVLNSGQVQHRNEFAWDVRLIQDDRVQHAFISPGGHIYVFTGLIRALENESELAGVLAHEIAHADRRHISRQLQNQYGINYLLSVVLGENPNQLAEIAISLVALTFSRDFEREADQYSVDCLNGTGYYAGDGAASYFAKADTELPAGVPGFLHNHPNPGSRTEAISRHAAKLGCAGRTVNNAAFAELSGLL